MARYLKQFFAVFVLIMGLVAMLNVAVDPNSIFRWSAVQGWNDQKTLKSGGGRELKSLILASHQFEVLFFGTSQGEVGFDPASPVLEGAQAFNASLSYTNMYELGHAMAFATQHQRPRLVVIALDFVSFSGSELTGGDFASSGFAGANLWPAYARRVFSAQSLKDSFSVMRKSRRGQRQFFAQGGNVDPAVRGAYDNQKEFHSLIATYLTDESPQILPQQRRQNTFLSFRYEPERVTLLQQLVSRFEQNGAQVLLFVPPVHAWYLDALTGAGLLPVYEQWKRDLTASMAALNTQAQRPVHLWDFSGYSAITTETVPQNSDPMRWYWDPAHFKAETGNLALARMLGREDAVKDFGVELTPVSPGSVPLTGMLHPAKL